MLLYTIALLLQLWPAAPAKKDKDLELLKTYMQGSFSSAQQAARDTSFYNIVLHMAPIWPERKDGFWLYVEQAVATMAQKPYRQRVYHVFRRADKALVSEVYTLSNPAAYVGAYDQTNPLADVNPDSLKLRAGCHIVLERQGEAFVGSTIGKGCPSERSGASYATSEVRLYPDRMISWDRGWGVDGKQVWGAEKGGYEFMKDL